MTGFILWVESHGKRRGGLTVEVKYISYNDPANVSLGRDLVEEMEQKLPGACDIDVHFEKKLTPQLVATWRDLGFSGPIGVTGQLMQRAYSGLGR